MSLVLALTVVAGVMAASFNHVLGMGPILAALLCAACFLRARDVLVIGVGAMLIHDFVVGFSVFTLVRLVAVLAVVGAIWMLRIRPAAGSLLLGLAVIVPLYHLALTTGDWITHFCTKEPHTLQGFVATLNSNLPYLQRSCLNDVVLTAAFLGAYTLSGSALRAWRPSALPAPSSR